MQQEAQVRELQRLRDENQQLHAVISQGGHQQAPLLMQLSDQPHTAQQVPPCCFACTAQDKTTSSCTLSSPRGTISGLRC